MAGDLATDDNAIRRRFVLRRPMSDMLVRGLVVTVPLAIATLVGLLGVEFQKHSDTYNTAATNAVGANPIGTARKIGTDVAGHLDRVRELTATFGALSVVGLVVMALWSWLMVTNTNRVGHTLRTPWFAALGWLIAPGLGLAAHVTLDQRLDSGSLIGLTVFLAVLYLPFGTLGGAAVDLGGSAHLARTWFLASVVGAFLLIAGVSGATSVLPVDNPQNVLRVRAFTCYLSAMMLLASSALAFATARDLSSLVSHRWARELDPEGVSTDPKRHKITRRGRQLRRRMTPTLFLRVIVTVGLLGSGLGAVAAVIVFRGRAVDETDAASTDALADLVASAIAIGAIAVAVHVVYVVWAVVAARNAFRRSIMAPSPWAVLSAFMLGPVVVVGSLGFTGPFGAAVLTIGIVATIAGFVIGQLILGRTVSSLGGRGRIFLTWMVVDFTCGLFAWYTSAISNDAVQTVALVVLQAGIALLGSALAWTAMTRLDRACRAYQHGGSMASTSPLPTPATASGQLAAGHVAVAAAADDPASSSPTLTSLALTSSQS
ncbi:MAG: hypothetical protein ABIR32_08055 [Ilumatobacteraceae bacterium]